MPLGILSEEAFQIEAERFHVSEIEIKHGRGPKEETPSNIRQFIASEAISGADVSTLSENFNISKSSISAYKNGATSTASYHNEDKELIKALERTRSAIIGPAQEKLMAAIAAITPDKLSESKVNVASAVARDMSSINKNISPEVQGQSIQNNIMVFKPRMKEEDDYEVIQVLE